MANTIQGIDISPIAERAPFLSSGSLSIAGLIALIFRVVIPIAGALFLLLLLYGGVIYMTAAGNEDQAGKAKRIMIDALIGLIIVVASFSIGTWIINALNIPTSIEVPTAIVEEDTNQPNQSNMVQVKVEVKDSQTSAPITNATITFNPATQASVLPLLPQAEAGITDTLQKILNNKSNQKVNSTGQSTQTTVSKVQVAAGQTAKLIPGAVYNVTVSATGKAPCTIPQKTFSQNGTFTISLASTGTNCSVAFAGSGVTPTGNIPTGEIPVPEQDVTIKTIDTENKAAVSTTSISLAHISGGTTGQAFLKGKTNTQGITSFSLDSTGQFLLTTANDAYEICEIRLPLQKGSRLTIELKKGKSYFINQQCKVASGITTASNQPAQKPITTNPTTETFLTTINAYDATNPIQGVREIKVSVKKASDTSYAIYNSGVNANYVLARGGGPASSYNFIIEHAQYWSCNQSVTINPQDVISFYMTPVTKNNPNFCKVTINGRTTN